MSTGTLDRLSGVSLLCGGVLAASGALPLIANSTNPFDPLVGPAGWLGLIGWMLLLLGLPRLYARQAHTAGILGLIAFVLLFLAGLLVGIGQNVDFALIIPWLAASAATRPAVVAGTPALEVFFIAGELVLVIGAVLFGIATMQARVFSRWVGILLIVSAVVHISGQALPLPGFLGPGGLVLLFAALAWFGGVLLVRRETGSMPSPFTASDVRAERVS